MTEVTIETTNYCNARCVFCPHSKSLRERGKITIPTLMKIIRTLREDETKISGINPVGLGEPLLHPDLFMIIATLKCYFPGIPIRIATNGINLTDKNIQGLLKVLKDGDSILISLNFSNPGEYQKMMGVYRYWTVKENILKLLDHTPKFTVKVQYLLTRQNWYKLPGFLIYWKPKADIVFIRPIEDWDGQVEIGDYKLFSPPKSDESQRVFTWDGKEVKSCMDLARVDNSSR